MGKYPGQISLIQLTQSKKIVIEVARVLSITQKNPPNGGLLYVGCLRYPVAPLQSRSILNSQREVKRFADLSVLLGLPSLKP